MSFDNELLQQTPDRFDRTFILNRREWLKLFGAGLLICAVDARALQESGARTRSEEENAPRGIQSWIHIGSDNRVTVFTGKAEMGQNIRTSLAQQVAEELKVPIDSIEMVMADTDLCPFDMGTFGSRTTPQMGTELRNIAAAAREMLIEMTAKPLDAKQSELVAFDGTFVIPSQHRSVRYSDLLSGQQLVRVIP
ncbi:MAG: molybdopterin-dependent oxidoreductase, partial [Acidobacteria bacterium]|nr:molybdopterin-dependent oxidoreductase [Acidobacteriota bacterium]